MVVAPCQSVTPYCKSGSCNIMRDMRNSFRLVLDGTWHNGGRNVLTGNDPEKVPNMQRTNPKSYKDHEGRKG